ncbi:hypothetical protein M514_02494 [Trichuris suis]|uniref:Uncharacterized protein n=1 Tax=Trichuris suis TaxID=68888 RepID=A0A085MHX1_9BILA|nr:hypothetical protein M513_02494 [Trichuris suis]KFD59378.1 hypothetical protein M514_02494 [Trichuris suis]
MNAKEESRYSSRSETSEKSQTLRKAEETAMPARRLRRAPPRRCVKGAKPRHEVNFAALADLSNIGEALVFPDAESWKRAAGRRDLHEIARRLKATYRKGSQTFSAHLWTETDRACLE